MFKKILIANRGEIACRVAATARRFGVRTVAVYSDADARAKHVAVCDEALHLGAASAAQSYLLGEKIIAAALASGAEAIHPGYGFLSENAEFAEACEAAGLVLIGPPASAMRAMGSKSAAKTLMESAHVPLVPGYHGSNQDPIFLRGEATRIGYPVLIKASAGGGGKGMRIVHSAAEFDAALASCKREALSSFRDDQVLIERYLTRPRHIEIQVFADRHGNCVYLHERDCSVQRRHQKVLEEAPAPGMSAQRRRAMGEAAVAAALAVNYVGAGTVEFIAEAGPGGEAGEFFFMEMNTRLQVEHPVTEMITGYDLVEWQLRVAAGEPLPATQDQLLIHGHALEARIYAENPDKNFFPSTGTLQHLRLPAAVEFDRGMHEGTPAAVRIDSGIRAGDPITPFYDPMIAKLIVWGADREQALARMRAALAATQIVGLSTNVAFLARLMNDAAFAGGDFDTGLIERHRATLLPAAQAPAADMLVLATAALLRAESHDGQTDPWGQASGWRLNQAYRRVMKFTAAGGPGEVTVFYARDGLRLAVGAAPAETLVIDPPGAQASTLHLMWGTQALAGDVVSDGETLEVFSAGRHAVLTLSNPLAHAGEHEVDDARLTAPMPGKIVSVLVKNGERVAKGASLLVMEAMKMEHTVYAPDDGVVEEVLFAVGDQVTEGAQLISFGQEAAKA